MRKRSHEGKRSASTVERPLERLRLFGDPTLRLQTRDVSEFDDRLKAFVDLMFDVMEREGGVGLAAPQVGSLSRVMVWKDTDDDDRRHVFVNARVVDYSGNTVAEEEGCLSVPGVVMQVTRAEEITVEARGLEGELFTVRLSGFPARVVQHEIDHLDGCLIVDRTSKEERRRVLKDLRERSLGFGGSGA